jgi:ABC-2 type transport system permease protein
VAAALAAGLIGGTLFELPGTGIATALATLAWFLFGYAFYAAAGALVSRQEDAQSASTPMIMLAMTAYLVSTVVVNPAPGSTAARVLSLLPPLTPLAMPTRIAAWEVAAWEVALSVVLMLLATWGVIRLGARVYTNALLRTGAPVPIREALRRRPSPAGG